jgi:hypothetical protein
VGERVAVRRTGGFIGGTAQAAVDVRLADPELLALVDRVLAAPPPRGGLPQPDRYTYDFDLCGTRVVVPEQHLTADLAHLAQLLLR